MEDPILVVEEEDVFAEVPMRAALPPSPARSLALPPSGRRVAAPPEDDSMSVSSARSGAADATVKTIWADFPWLMTNMPRRLRIPLPSSPPSADVDMMVGGHMRVGQK